MSNVLVWYTPPQEPLVQVLCPPDHLDYAHTYARIECQPPLLPENPEAVFRYWSVLPGSMLPQIGRCTGKHNAQARCEQALRDDFTILPDLGL